MKLFKINHENTKVRTVLKANAAKHETRHENQVAGDGFLRCDTLTHTAITYYKTMPVIGIFFVFSKFRAFVIILFFFASCVTAQVENFREYVPLFALLQQAHHFSNLFYKTMVF